MKFPPYESYKDTGIEWLRCIPSHWEICRVGTLFKQIGDEGADGLPILSVSIHDGVSDGELDEDELERTVVRSEDRTKYKRVMEGDLVYNMMRAWQGGFGTVGVEGLVSPAYVVARPIGKLHSRLAEHVLRTPQVIEAMRCRSHGVTDFRLRLYWEVFKDLVLPVPPPAEQRALLNFIDSTTAKIDTLVSEEQRLTALLREEVDSRVLSSFEDSETQLVRLANVAQTVSRPVTLRPEEAYTRIGLFNRGRGLFHKPASMMGEMGDSDFFWVESGDLIISGQFAWEGAVALAAEKDAGCVVSHRYPVIRGNGDQVLTEYLWAFFCTDHGLFLLNEHSRGAAGRNRPLNINSLMKEQIPIPSRRTQDAIAHAIRVRSTLLVHIANSVALLHERRAALIESAVMGRMDVRNAASIEAA